MNKRIAGLVAGGVLAGAALVGVPAFALTTQGDESPSGGGASTEEMRQMGAVMSDPKFQDQMKSFMSEMMGDPQLREQMISMMSEAMGGKDGQMGGMAGMGGDSGTPQGEATP